MWEESLATLKKFHRTTRIRPPITQGDDSIFIGNVCNVSDTYYTI